MDGAASLGVVLIESQVERLLRYASLLQKWNKSFNLISRRDMGRLSSRHLLDSLSGLSLLHGTHIMDLGSGGGLPGIPLAIAAPDQQFCLCDRSERRTRFLREVARSLVLDNVEVWCGNYGSERPTQAAFDTVVARGVATVAELWAMVQAQLSADGRLVVYASTQGDVTGPAQDEYPALLPSIPGEQRLSVIRQVYNIPGLEQHHALLCVERAITESEECRR